MSDRHFVSGFHESNCLCSTLGGGLSAPLQSLSSKFRTSLGQLFCSSGEDSDDPLVEVVRRDANAASLFLRAVMLFSGVGSAIVAVASAAFLSCFWNDCGGCDRPLRWWLLAHALLQLTQVPVRLVFFTKLQCDTSDVGTELSVCDFTSSPAWRVSKHISLATYGWFVIGVVWVLNAGSCKSCPGIYRMTAAVIVQAVLRAAVALVCFRVLFPGSDAISAGGVSQLEPATRELIETLPLVIHSNALFDDPAASCAVCLSEYSSGEQLRQLPCGHYFHSDCADRWLSRNKKCPLCMGPIDKASSRNHLKIE